MHIEIDARPRSAKFVVDGHELDVTSIRDNPGISVDTSGIGIKVEVVFYAEEVTFTDYRGVTFRVDKDGAMQISGTDREAVRRAAGVTD